MGRDLRLYPNDASKTELVSFVMSFKNMRTSSHLWDWPEGTEHFFWFDDKDYRSITGVEITIYPIRNSESAISSGKWAMHVRNTYSATWHDVDMLNKVLRTGRKKFGGNIFGDYGKNRYAPLWDDNSTPMSRGLAWVSGMAHENIRAVSHALPDEYVTPEGDSDLGRIIASADPARVIYNGLVPFLISILEFYLKNAFIIGLQYDLGAQGRVRNYLQELGPEVSLGGKNAEEFIADKISFQDLHNVKKAFRKWLTIDIKKPLDQSVTMPIESLWRRLNDLIQYRHDLIHRMGVDTDFSRGAFLKQSQLVEEALDVLLKTFVEKYHIDIELTES
jgi:hypothetical protein